MPSDPQQSFDHEATLEELAGVGKNHRFDEIIDDEEFKDIQVICKRGDAEIPLAKPSRAFYFGDRNLYDQEAKRFDQEEKARILNTDQFRNNLQVFEELKRSCQRGFVIPFVGAGMSKSAGLPEWKEYLVSLCDDAGLTRDAILDRLETQGDYEGAMNDIVERLTLNRFERDFERSFQIPETITGAVSLLPKLFDCAVITTNFDRVLERVYENEGRVFVEKVTGRGLTNAFFRAIPAGERYLLKLHGNIDNAAERVLNKAEYDTTYGNDGNIHFECPVPKLLRRLFSSYSFLFLGCSLSADRTILTFMKVAQEIGGDSLPHHYAILASPAGADKKRTIDQRLADAHITPLWYPEGEHNHVEEILQLLLE
ncbi:MAG: SIR2 family protein [Syntrophales bacterium]